MDNFDRIDALRIYYSQYGYDNYIIIKEICKNLHQYDSLSYPEIKSAMLSYINNIPVENINENDIDQIITSLLGPPNIYSAFDFSQFFNLSNFSNTYLGNSLFSMSINNPQEDVPIVLKKKCLDKLEIKNYKDVGEELKKDNPMCMIKLEDFNDDDKVRILPCNHVFSCEMIDNWLLKESCKCPVCRKKVGESEAKI